MMSFMGAMRGRLLSELLNGDVAVFDLAYSAGSLLSEHRHDRAYVSVLAEGSYTELRDGLPHRCMPGTAILHASGEVHADYFVAEGRCVNFELHGEDSASFDAILRVAATTHPRYERAIRTALAAHRERLHPSASPAWLLGVLADFRWVEPVPLSAASKIAGMHPTHFVRAFRRYVGMTPGRYRRRERVRAVSTLLLDSAASLSRVAVDCGFSDQSHLSNVFREATGISPRLYRRTFAR
jgi:AraC-like DNA-binding protein